MALYIGYAVRLEHATLPVVLPVDQASAPRNVDVGAEPSSGNPTPTTLVIRSLRPTISLTSRSIREILAITGASGAPIGSTETYTGITLFQAKLNSAGLLDSGAVHRSIKMDAGILLPRTINAQAAQDATIQSEFLGISSDGVTSPVTITNNVTLPDLPTDEERYTIGPVTLESITLDRLSSLTIDFGLTNQQQQLDSAVYPSLLNVSSWAPTVQFDAMAPDKFDAAAIPEGGLSVTQANTSIYLRQRAQGSALLEADANLKHLLLDCAGLAYVEDSHSASGNDPARITGRVAVSYDGTNSPIVITPNSAIA